MMSQREPKAIGRREAVRRRQRIGRIARSCGFRGRIEYRHVYSQSGGAQFCIGAKGDDVLIVYAEAFDRDRDPDDFSLRAVIAHECGHQRLLRDPRLSVLGRKISGSAHEEVLASLIGSLLVGDSVDAQHLVWKATVELATVGLPAAEVVRTIEQLRALLREFV
jgi:hypothetical protein